MLANPYAIAFVVVLSLLLVSKYAYKAVCAGWRRDPEEIARQIGVLDPDGRAAVLFGRIGAGFLPRTRMRLLEYRGGQVAVSRLDGGVVALGVLTKASKPKTFEVFPRVRFEVLPNGPPGSELRFRGVLTRNSVELLEAAGVKVA